MPKGYYRVPRVSVRQLQSGQWAAFAGKKYWPSTVSDTKVGARIKRLHEIALDYRVIIDAISIELHKIDPDFEEGHWMA